MPQALATTLVASAAVVADGSSTAVDLGSARRALALVVRCTTFTEVSSSPTPSVRIDIEHGSSASGPWLVADSVTISGTGEQLVSVAGLQQYVRCTWTLTNMTTATFGVDGKAHQVYADPSDITRYAVTEVAIAEKTGTERVDALISASSFAEGHLSSSFEMPIDSWGDDLRMAVARIAADTLLRVRGADANGPDVVVFDGAKEATKWLNRISDGKLKPPEIVDQTTEAFEGGAFVTTTVSRGW